MVNHWSYSCIEVSGCIRLKQVSSFNAQSFDLGISSFSTKSLPLQPKCVQARSPWFEAAQGQMKLKFWQLATLQPFDLESLK